jgi:molybdate transport system ATP-binding protein
VRRVLARLQLWRLRRRKFLTLSHGERRLTLLARALAGRPRLLLLDEPYNGLDRRCRQLLDRELARLARTRATVVLSAHRIEDAPRTFRRAVVVARGRVVYDGALARAPRRWLHPTASAGEAPRGATSRERHARDARPPPLVELRNVDLFRDYRPVIRRLDWTIEAGEHWAIIGANGSGKSTLLRFLYGDLAAALGAEVRRRDHGPGSHIDEWRRRVGLVSPELQAEYLERVSVEGLVVSGLRTTIGLESAPTARERARARHALRRVGLKVGPERSAHALSYGQRRLALIARALIRQPEALLLDEPLTGLDAAARARVKRLLSSLARGGMQLIVAAHHAGDLPPEVDRMLVLGAGRGTIRDRSG